MSGLKSSNLLVLEDDFLIASDLAMDLESMGLPVLGPFGSVQPAAEMAGLADAAILDIRIRDETSFPVAGLLKSRKIPFVFYTGYHELPLPPQFRDVRSFAKPTATDAMVRDLGQQQMRQALPTDPVDVVELMPRLHQRAKELMPDARSADRLVEATLQSALRTSRDDMNQPEFERWLHDVLETEYLIRGPQFLN